MIVATDRARSRSSDEASRSTWKQLAAIVGRGAGITAPKPPGIADSSTTTRATVLSGAMAYDRETAEAAAAARLQHLQACVIPILGEGQARAGVHGSASLFARGDNHFVVTATHVAKYLTTHAELLGVPTQATTLRVPTYTLGVGQLALTPEDEEDVAVFRLDDPAAVQRLRDGGRVFLNDHDVATEAQQVAARGDGLVFGWPDSGTRFEQGTVHGKAIAMQLGRIPPPHDAQTHHLFLEWPNADDVPELPGISGSPIWAVAPDEPAGVWHPSKEVKLIGVQHSVLKGAWIRGSTWRIAARLIEDLSK